MLQKDHNKRLSCKELLKHDFLTKSVHQFKPMDVRTIPGVVAQQGGFVNINSGAGNKKQNLGETVWDIFVQPNQGIQQPKQVGVNNQVQYQVPQINYAQNQPSYPAYPMAQGYQQVNMVPSNNQYQYNNNGVMTNNEKEKCLEYYICKVNNINENGFIIEYTCKSKKINESKGTF